MTKQKLLIIGGGHAHIYLLNNLEKLKQYATITLVSDGIYQIYSGMASGYLEDIYTLEDISFNLWKLCEKSKIDFIDSKVIKVDPDNNRVFLSNGVSLLYDVISFNIGSEINTFNVENASHFGTKIKPYDNLKKIKEMIKAYSEKNIKLVIIGGGAAGFEISIALNNYCHKNQKISRTILLDSNKNLLPSFPVKAQKYGIKYIKKNRITFLSNKLVTGINENHIFTDDNQTLNFDYLFWTTGTKAKTLFLDSTITTDKQGFLRVNKFLQHNFYKNIFGAGDCISIDGFQSLPKVGVYSVKEGPILLKNLVSYITRKTLTPFSPHKNFLAILSAGNKKGILVWKNIVLKGTIVWNLKNKIDTHFIKINKKY